MAPEWSVVYYTDNNIVIIHRAKDNVHAMVPPYGEYNMQNLLDFGILDWSPQNSVRWLKLRKKHRGNINCSCGHWVKIPPAILEQFIATVNLIRRE
jgi:hypothetical protein